MKHDIASCRLNKSVCFLSYIRFPRIICGVLPINVRLNIERWRGCGNFFICNQDSVYQTSTRTGLLTVLTEIFVISVEVSI